MKKKISVIKNIAERRARRKIKRNRAFRRRRSVHRKSGRKTRLLDNFYDFEENVILKRPCDEFTLLENTEEVISYLQELKSYKSQSSDVDKIIVDLRGIKKIDIGAICILLSVVEELSINNVKIEGNFPEDEACKKIFVESGFLAHMKNLTGNKFAPPENKNLIIKQGRGTTKNKEIGIAVKEAMEKITGTASHYHPVYSIIQEINGNAVEHAYSENEHWLFAFNYNPATNRVIFTFADNGYGILKTLKKKFSQQITDELINRSDSDILLRAFNKKYTSRHTDQGNRNKGLPLLNKIQRQKEVKNLIVITNKVSLHLEKGSVRDLNSYFSGTFYYWELDAECIENGRKSN